jgi:hypothetical protein
MVEIAIFFVMGVSEALSLTQKKKGVKGTGTLLEGNPYLGFPSNGRFAPCHPSKEHLAIYLQEGYSWRETLFPARAIRSSRGLPGWQRRS